VAAVGCGDFWCSPSVLKNIPDMANNNGLTVHILPYTDGDGQTYQAIRFDFISNDLRIALVYDLDIGVLLYHTFDYTSFSPAGLKSNSHFRKQKRAISPAEPAFDGYPLE
jgi:hypothetical protein